MRFVDGSVKLLGWGSVGLGLWGLIHPKSLTRLMGDDPQLGRLLGARDAVVGIALLQVANPLPLGLRMASDLQDALRLRHRSPNGALGAAAVSLWSAVVLTVRLRRAERMSAADGLFGRSRRPDGKKAAETMA
jgi:hypothetical protein